MAIATVRSIRGTARLGRRTKDLVKRLGPGDVAVIDHLNLDRIAAEELAACGARAALNAAPSSDGTYPNTGPLALVRAGVPLIDAGPELFDRIADGDQLEIDGGRIHSGGRLITEGRVTFVDGLLASAVLAGLLLNATLGWWWADPLAGLVIVVYGVREGSAALRAVAA